MRSIQLLVKVNIYFHSLLYPKMDVLMLAQETVLPGVCATTQLLSDNSDVTTVTYTVTSPFSVTHVLFLK